MSQIIHSLIDIIPARDATHDHQRALCFATVLKCLRHLAVQPISYLTQGCRIARLSPGKQCSSKLIELFRVIICEAKRPDQGSSEWLVLIGSAERSSHI